MPYQTEDTALPMLIPIDGRPKKTTGSHRATWVCAFLTYLLGASSILLTPLYGPAAAAMDRTGPRLSSQRVPFHSDMPPPSYPVVNIRRQPLETGKEPLWPLVREALQLDPRLDNDRVQQELAWLRKHPDFVQRLAPRMKRYAPYIFRELDRRKMPGELLFLAMIESALDPFAFSPGGAAGLWQFMPATGERFGLKIDWWADERRDPVLATRAALDYLELLYRRFDSWELAIAAYNAGEGRISRAVRKAGSRDFSDLQIPQETAGYLPRLLAFAEVFNHPETYGLRLPFVSARVAQRVIETGSQLDLSQAAKALNVPLDDLYDWNPALNQWATHPRGPHRLLVGKTRGDPQLRVDEIAAQDRLSWQRHSVTQGETLSDLAEHYHTDVAAIVRANKLSSKVIHSGESLLIPTGKVSAFGALPARRHGVGKKIYRVVRGDSLWKIAKRFGVTSRELQRLNDIETKERLSVGAQLIIPTPPEDVVKQINYRVRAGDSLSRIAQKFNVTTAQILGWNQLNLAKYLHPGQKLRLYVDLTVAN